ncbi:winged helix-turn-helix transcriptional regulator [Pseudomonas sp. B6(2017)]|uniref:winged helix-turn-helix transcriptional regulator n=1 Tax=Pseudomonas sp. B6(2017) TaxID=1981713 RepID=UPI003531E0A6
MCADAPAPDTLLRFNELQWRLPGISQRPPTRQLRDLEAVGLILDTAYAEVPPRLQCRSVKEMVGARLARDGLVNAAFIQPIRATVDVPREHSSVDRLLLPGSPEAPGRRPNRPLTAKHDCHQNPPLVHNSLRLACVYSGACPQPSPASPDAIHVTTCPVVVPAGLPAVLLRPGQP